MKSFFFKGSTFIATTLLVAMNTSPLQGQNGARNPVSTINPVAPSTAALLKYVDCNVNSNTGVPDISIPLFEIKGKQLSLPLSISYNASGIKVNEQAGNIGLCWSLNAAGLISKAIRGKEDDGTYWTNVPAAIADGFNPLETVGDFKLAKNINMRGIDGAPDIYSYNFGSASGKFMDIPGKTPSIVMLPRKPLLIEKKNDTTYQITSEDGTKYFFGALEKTTIRTSYGSSTGSYTWHLTKILSADSTDQIDFTYENTYYEDLPALGESFTYIYAACNMGTEVKSGSKPDTYFYSSSRIKGKQLKRIVFSEGSVDFNVTYDRQDTFGDAATVRNPKINRIILKNLAGEEIKTVSFNYSYYNAGISGLYAKRLRLDRLDICPQSSLCGIPKYTNSYKFTYNATPLPLLNSFAQDHWGYYNGVSKNSTLLPNYPIQLTPAPCFTKNPFCVCTTPPLSNSFTGADRNCEPNFVKAGILETIEYPTGGNIQFNFEANQAAPLSYAEPLAKARTKSVQNNTAANGTLISATTDPSDVIPVNDPNIIGGVCAIASVEYFDNGVPEATLRAFRPTAKLYKYDANGTGTVVATIPMGYVQGTYNYNFTMAAGYSYAVMVTTQAKGTTIKGNLNYSLPIIKSMPYYVGGLRLKQKTVYDPVALTSMITTYSYTGASFKQPSYEQYSVNFQLSSNTCGEPCAGTGGNGGIMIYDKHEYTTLIANYGGIDNEINYEEVVTSYGAAGENGKTITHYTPYNNDYFWRKGSINDQQDFNASGKILKKLVNHYATAAGTELIQGLEVSGVYEHPCLDGQPQNFGIYSKYVSYKPTFNPSEWFYMDTTTTYMYDAQSSNSFVTKTSFYYGNPLHMQLSGITTKNSRGITTAKSIRYPQDFTLTGTLSGSAATMKEMVNRHILSTVVEEASLLLQPPNNLLISSADGTLNTFKINNKQVVKDASYRLKIAAAANGNTENPVTNFAFATITNGQLVYDARYELENQFTRYDLNQNPIELKQRDNKYAFRCPVNGDLWASTTNAFFDETAYTSFEHGNIATDFTNWNYNNANVFTDAAPFPNRGTYNGTKAYLFAGSEVITNRIPLSAAQKFKVSFWAKTGAITVSTTSPENSTTMLSLRTGPIRGGWTYYEAYFTNATQVKVQGRGMIDELRLYPASARMTTYVYKNAVGVLSKCSENNQNTFWEYDEFNRMRLTQDQDGYILNKNEYNYLQTQ